MNNKEEKCLNNSFLVSKNILLENNRLWMLTNMANVLCEFSFPGMKLEKYYVLPMDTVIEYGCHSFVKMNNTFFVLPFYDKEFIVVDTDNNKTYTELIPYADDESDRKGKFHIAVENSGKILMVGHNISGFFYYVNDMFHVDYSYITNITNAGVKVDNLPLFSECFTQSNEYVYIPVLGQKIIVEVNIVTEKYKVYDLKNDIQIRTIDLIDENTFFLTTMCGEKVIWSKTEGIQEYKNLNLLEGDERWYMRAFYVNGKFYYISGCERKIFVEKNGVISELYFDYPMDGAYPIGWTQFEAIYKKDDLIIVQTRSDGTIFCINTKTDEINKVCFNISLCEKNNLIRDAYSNKKIGEILDERKDFNLNNFISFI
ncbi:MAG: hypothetical protein J6I76_02295 [Oribacterium sp.]|nr:hypothetical protein [Oribacterium sp.]